MTTCTVLILILACCALTALADDLQSIPHAEWVEADSDDGDSFRVRFPDPATGGPREEVVRL